MVSLPFAPPVRFGAADLPSAMELRLARRGGRAFAPRGAHGDVRVTLPEVGGVATVLVPRGFGHPLPAVRAGGELRAEQGGAPCAPARWVPAGGLAAWMRAVPLPRGPARLVPPELPTGAGGPWIHVRVAALEWSALRRIHAAAGHGAVAVADRWVRAVSPEARARGVVRGMSVALARRRCPGLTVWPRPLATLGDAVHARLSAWLGPVEPAGHGMLARLGAGVALGPQALAHAERVARLLWQELGVEARVAVAASPEAARGLGAVLEPGWVAVAPAGASDAWTRRGAPVAVASAGARAARWRGEALPDLEGAAARARALTPGLLAAARGGVLHVKIEGARGARTARVRVPEACGRTALGRLAEDVVRREGALLGPIAEVTLTCVAAPAQAERHAEPEARVPEAAGTGGEAAAPERPAARRPRLRVAPTVPEAAAEPLLDPAADAAVRRRARATRREPDASERVQLALLPGLR